MSQGIEVYPPLSISQMLEQLDWDKIEHVFGQLRTSSPSTFRMSLSMWSSPEVSSHLVREAFATQTEKRNALIFAFPWKSSLWLYQEMLDLLNLLGMNCMVCDLNHYEIVKNGTPRGKLCPLPNFPFGALGSLNPPDVLSYCKTSKGKKWIYDDGSPFHFVKEWYKLFLTWYDQ